MAIFNYLLKDTPVLLFLVLAFFVIKYAVQLHREFLKSVNKSEFDKIFSTKDQNRWHAWYNQISFCFLFALFVNVISYLFALSIYENPHSLFKILSEWIFIIAALFSLASFFAILLVVFYFKAALPFYKRYIKETETSRNLGKKSRNMINTLFNSHLVAVYLCCIGLSTIKFLSIQELNSFDNWLALAYGLLFMTIGVFLYFHFQKFIFTDIFHQAKPTKQKFKMTVPHQLSIQTTPLFALYSLDEQHLVLGNKETEETSTQIYLYNRDKNTYLMFTKH